MAKTKYGLAFRVQKVQNVKDVGIFHLMLGLSMNTLHFAAAVLMLLPVTQNLHWQQSAEFQETVTKRVSFGQRYLFKTLAWHFRTTLHCSCHLLQSYLSRFFYFFCIFWDNNDIIYTNVNLNNGRMYYSSPYRY